MSCLSDEEVLAFLQGGSTGPDAARVDEHLAGCAACRALVAEASRYDSPQRPTHTPTRPEPGSPGLRPRREASLAPGTPVGRYVIEGPLGAGAGGAVYRAHDPQLKRAVALKIVAAAAGPDGDLAQAQARVLREAEAMARLQHPNVVAVFDAGAYQDSVFIVMELVEGETLADWLRRKPEWPRVLASFIEAGRGLAAAHAAGLVHRDFKPGNVLVGADGRVRVTDFGLARPPGAVADAAAGSGSSGSPHTAVAGTPYFMAPEQFAGGVANPRTDQYSFAVALFVALHGYHPTEDGQAAGDAPAKRPEIPIGVHQALARALSEDAERRYPAIESMISALEDARAPAVASPRRWRRLALLLAAGGLVGGAVIAARGPGQRVATAGRCGNGAVEAPEECDDGNASSIDGCLPSCRFARCGDGSVRRGVEECDDGNVRDGDGCSARCLLCREGDASFVWPDTGHCYSRHDGPVEWVRAASICGGLRGHLVTYSASYESRAVRESLFAERQVPHWVGLVRGAAGAFEWVTLEPLPPLPRWWEPGEPRANGPPCVLATPVEKLLDPTVHYSGSPWRTAPCAETRSFVCERPEWSVRPKDNHAYRLFFPLVPWDEANRACAAAGGHLATIGDTEELSFVPIGSRNDLWLGATDRRQEGRFSWETGEPFTPAFAPGEPDDRDGSNDCLVVGRDRLFHDRRCTDVNASLCEID